MDIETKADVIESHLDHIETRNNLTQAEIVAINSRITLLEKRVKHHMSLGKDAHTGGKAE